MKHTKHSDRKSFKKFALTGQNSGVRTGNQARQSHFDQLAHAAASNRSFATMDVRSNIPFRPWSILSRSNYRTNKYRPEIKSKSIVVRMGERIVHALGLSRQRSWHGKSERRQVIRDRREDRLAGRSKACPAGAITKPIL